MARKIIIGSRGSDLALWQARFTQETLQANGYATEIKIIKTTGDKIQHLSFDKIEGKGFFTKEIEEALLKQEIDLAVHSHKDLESNSPEGLVIGGVSDREDPSELLLVRKEAFDPKRELSLKKNAIVGTSSSRRKSQLLALQPEVEIKDIRGNVPTRVDKLRKGEFDAILLAYAGVKRLNLIINDLVAIKLDPHIFVPAPAQGVLAFQCRKDDQEVLKALSSISNEDKTKALQTERAVLKELGGGCQMPFGIHCTEMNGLVEGEAVLAKSWNGFPRRYRFQTNAEIPDVKGILENLRKEIASPVLITRKLSEDSYLERYCKAHGVELIEQSYISVSPTEFKDETDTDWIFFSSPNSVRHYLGQGGMVSGRKLGVFGRGTSKTLAEAGLTADYEGASADPGTVAKEFREAVGNGSVLFPVSDISLESIGKVFPPEKKTMLPVYHTEPKHEQIPRKVATAIFTSPSNVRAFFEYNNRDMVGRYIALGPSTEKALKEYGILAETAYLPTEFALASML